MKKIAIVLLALVCAGCIQKLPEQTWSSDQCKRAELFQTCLQSLPAGPVSTHYNDWDEVVAECETAAYRQSVRNKGAIKPECRSE